MSTAQSQDATSVAGYRTSYYYSRVVLLVMLLSPTSGNRNLTALIPHADSVILCPDDDFILRFECDVPRNIYTHFIEWTFPPFFETDGMFTLSETNDTQSFTRNGSITIFIARNDTGVISHLRIPTSSIFNADSNNTNLTVTCSADGNFNENITISISNSGEDKPTIINASINANGEMFVSWELTDIRNIIKTIVSAKNTVTGIEICTTVGWNVTEASFKVDVPADYNVTVTVLNSCGEEFSSNPYPVDGTDSNIIYPSPCREISKETCSSTKYVYLSSCHTSLISPTQQCPRSDRAADKGLIAGLSVPIVILILIVILLAVMLLYLYVKKEKRNTENVALSSRNQETTQESDDTKQEP